MPSRVMSLRRDGLCCRCATALPKGTSAYWDADERTVTCLDCLRAPSVKTAALPRLPARGASEPPRGPELDRGHPGASAAREHRRRRTNREAGVRARHSLLGGLLLAISRPPQHERAWETGSKGEEAVGHSLERRAKKHAVLLHDRRMPKGHGNIDHLAVAPRGVFVIDAKAVKGKVRVSRPLFGEPRLMIAGRNRAKLIDGLDRQVSAVRTALAQSGRGDVPVLGVLCFTKADLPLFGAGEIRGHRLHHSHSTARKLNQSGPLDRDAIDAIARELEVAFPCA